MIPRSRKTLGNLIKTVSECEHVYFQPPSNTRMSYPCVIYKLSSGDTTFANDKPYVFKKRYEITVIDENPDSLIPDKIAQLESCIMDRHFVSDNLNHWAFYLYF